MRAHDSINRSMTTPFGEQPSLVYDDTRHPRFVRSSHSLSLGGWASDGRIDRPIDRSIDRSKRGSVRFGSRRRARTYRAKDGGLSSRGEHDDDARFRVCLCRRFPRRAERTERRRRRRTSESESEPSHLSPDDKSSTLPTLPTLTRIDR